MPREEASAGPVTWESGTSPPERDPAKERDIVPDKLVDAPSDEEKVVKKKKDLKDVFQIATADKSTIAIEPDSDDTEIEKRVKMQSEPKSPLTKKDSSKISMTKLSK